MPVIASTHEALRASSIPARRKPAIEPFARPRGLEADQRRDAIRRRDDEIGAAELLQLLGRQVHAPALPILAYVAEDVRQLHCDAEVVGESRTRAPGGLSAVAEDRQAQPTDRAGDVAAIDDELIERLVGGLVDVELDAVDQQAERVRRQLVATQSVIQPGCDGVIWPVDSPAESDSTISRSAASARS